MTEKEFNQCVNLHADNVYRFILKNIRNEEDAKDIVQSAFEKLWMKHSTVENATSKSYLFTVAFHKMIDYIRKTKRIILKENFNENSGGISTQQISTSRILEESLNRLTKVQKSLIMLKDYEGYSYAEIEKITGLNEGQVKINLHRARLQLREYIGKPENVI